jgi:hypothetical protein
MGEYAIDGILLMKWISQRTTEGTKMANSFTIGSVVPGVATTFGKYKKVEALSEGKDHKLERIINKFRAGQKLTGGELSYLAENAPDIYNKVLRVMMRREQLERRLEQARTAEEAAKIVAEEMQAIAGIGGEDDFEKTATLNHLRDAYNKHLSGGSFNGTEAISHYNKFASKAYHDYKRPRRSTDESGEKTIGMHGWTDKRLR